MVDVTKPELDNSITDTNAAVADITAARASLLTASTKLTGAADVLTRVRTQLFPTGTVVTPPPPTGANFTIQNGLIYGPDGTVFTPKGANVMAANSYVWGDSFFWATGQANKDRFLSYGWNAIRLVYCESCVKSHAPGSQNYGLLSDLITLYTTGANKMVVIIDNHNGYLGGPTSQAEINEAVSLFTGFANTYKTNPYVWFETYNEPQEEGWGSLGNTTSWLSIQRPVCTAIRNTGATNIIVCCASHYGQDRGSYTNDINAISNDSVLIRALPTLRSEYGAVVGDMHAYERWGDATTDAAMRAYFDKLKDLGCPLIIGEHGAWNEITFDARGASERLYRVAPRGVGIFPWASGSAPNGTLWPGHAAWVANVDSRAVGGVGSGGGTTAPPSVRPFVSNLTATGQNGALKLDWVNPSLTNVAQLIISWGGPNGYINTQVFFAGGIPTTYTITGLTNGVTYTANVGFQMNGETEVPYPSGFTEVSGSPLVSGGGGGTTAPPSGGWPAAGTWNEKAAWIKSVAGCKTANLKIVSSTAQSVPAGNAGAYWSSAWGGLYVDSPGTIANLDVRGQIIIGPNANGLTIRDCKFMGLFSNGGEASLVERSTVTININTEAGQGALNAMAGGSQVIRCDLSGFADGIQWAGGGTVIETHIHDLRFTTTTHNDFIQNYSNNIDVYRTLCQQENRPNNGSQANGIFSSNDNSASFYLEDCIIAQVNDQGGNAWVCHANTSFIQCVRCRLAGPTVFDVRYGSDTLKTGMVTVPFG